MAGPSEHVSQQGSIANTHMCLPSAQTVRATTLKICLRNWRRVQTAGALPPALPFRALRRGPGFFHAPSNVRLGV